MKDAIGFACKLDQTVSVDLVNHPRLRGDDDSRIVLDGLTFVGIQLVE